MAVATFNRDLYKVTLLILNVKKGNVCAVRTDLRSMNNEYVCLWRISIYSDNMFGILTAFEYYSSQQSSRLNPAFMAQGHF